MNEPLESTYFEWLCAKVLSRYVSNYYDLMQILFRTEFVWFIPGDRNRAADGIELREYFFREAYIKRDPEWFNEPCSVFEVFIAFAQRASFQTDIPVRDCFWLFMNNLKLDDYRQVSKADIPVIEEIIYTFIWRTYEETGCGGLFPLDDPTEDQRKVEVWYQFCAWVDEKELV